MFKVVLMGVQVVFKVVYECDGVRREVLCFYQITLISFLSLQNCRDFVNEKEERVSRCVLTMTKLKLCDNDKTLRKCLKFLDPKFIFI